MTILIRKELIIQDFGNIIEYKLPIIEIYGENKNNILFIVNIDTACKHYEEILKSVWSVIKTLRTKKINGKVSFIFANRKVKETIYSNFKRILAKETYDYIIEILNLGSSYPYFKTLNENAYSLFRDKMNLPVFMVKDKNDREIIKKLCFLCDDKNYALYVGSSAVTISNLDAFELNCSVLVSVLTYFKVISENSLDGIKIKEILNILNPYTKAHIINLRKFGGLLLPNVNVGSKVMENNVLFEIKNVFGETIHVEKFNHRQGIVVSLTQKSLVKPLEYIMTIAVP